MPHDMATPHGRRREPCGGQRQHPRAEYPLKRQWSRCARTRPAVDTIPTPPQIPSHRWHTPNLASTTANHRRQFLNLIVQPSTILPTPQLKDRPAHMPTILSQARISGGRRDGAFNIAVRSVLAPLHAPARSQWRRLDLERQSSGGIRCCDVPFPRRLLGGVSDPVTLSTLRRSPGTLPLPPGHVRHSQTMTTGGLEPAPEGGSNPLRNRLCL